jgi:tetratricopeptide (TPR) repeat protein
VLALQRLAEVRAYQGEHAAAQDHLMAALAIAVDPPMATHVWVRVYATAAANALDHGDAVAAMRAIEAAAETIRRSGSCEVCGAHLNPIATRTFLTLGDIDRAEYHAQEAERTAAYWESSTWRALAETARAEVDRARGDVASASQRFKSAAAAFERVDQPFDAARCLLEAGQTVTDGDDAAAARNLVGQALVVFENLGAATAAARARGLLDRP